MKNKTEEQPSGGTSNEPEEIKMGERPLHQVIAMAQICLAIHDRLGIQFGEEDPMNMISVLARDKLDITAEVVEWYWGNSEDLSQQNLQDVIQKCKNDLFDASKDS